MSETDILKGRLDVLPSLQALLDEQSVTAAAARMGVTQPAMSRTLDQLRALFDDPLLVRVGARMHLTPKAANLVDPLRDVLAAAADLYAATTFEPQSARRTFRAVIPDVLAAPLLPRLLERLADEAPGCQLHLTPWPRQHEPAPPIDFAITSEAQVFPAFRMEPLFRDHDVLARVEPPDADTDVLALDHVAVIAAGMDDDPVDRWLGEIGHTRRIRAIVPHYLLALELVAQAGFSAILPARTVAALGPAKGVSSFELPLDQEPDQMWLLYPPHHESDPAARWLRSLVTHVCMS